MTLSMLGLMAGSAPTSPALAQPESDRVQPSAAVMEAYQVGRYREALDELLEQLQVCQSEPDRHDRCLDLLHWTAGTAGLAGDPSAGETWARVALSLSHRLVGEQHPDSATSANNLAFNIEAQGRYAEAEPLYRKALAIQLAVLGDQHPDTATGYNNLAVNLYAQGRYADAEPLLRKALAIRLAVLGNQHPDTATSYSNLAGSLNVQGRYAEAEPLLRKALAIRLAVLGDQHPDTATSYNNLAYNLHAQRRYAEAEPLYQKALAIRLAVLGDQHPNTATGYSNLAANLNAQRRYVDAEPLLRKAVEIRLAAVGDEHPDTARSYNNLAVNLSFQERDAEAEPLYQRALAIRQAVLGEQHPDTASSYNNLAVNLNSRGHHTEAEPLYNRALEIRRAVLREDHPDLIVSQSNLAWFWLERDTNPGEALALARAATASLDARRLRDAALRERDTNDDSGLRWAHRVHLGATWLHARQGDLPRRERRLLRDEGFAAAQRLLSNGTGRAVAQMTARFAADDDQLATLAREQQDLAWELDALDRRLLAALTANEADNADRLRQRSAEVLARFTVLNTEIGERFPEYDELVNPPPLSINEVQRALGRRDALVMLVPWNEQTFVFAVNRLSATWQRLDVTEGTIAERVQRLRCQVDASTCPASAGNRPAADMEEQDRAVAAASALAPVALPSSGTGFDRAVAHALYVDLLGPLMPVIGEADHLYVVTRGALTSLPLSVLVTEAPADGEDDRDLAVLRDTPWLGAQYALTTLPTVSDLRSLQRLTDDLDGGFVGVGDPVLGRRNPAANRDVAFVGGELAGTAQADPESLRSGYQELQGAGRELKAMAAALGADPETALFLREQATERVVKALDLRREVLAFATHGFLASDPTGLGEPGLVLTPPDEPSDLDDGLLTASEVAQLSLAADWVILAACNTAAADGAGGEGLSGLARAFLYAGARSLLVSHWRVDDTVTAELTVATIESAKHRDKAAALRQAMALIRNGKTESGEALPKWQPQWAHPSYWAPFVVVGANDN